MAADLDGIRLRFHRRHERPRIESYFNKCASVFVSVRSLTATNRVPVIERSADHVATDTAEAVNSALIGILFQFMRFLLGTRMLLTDCDCFHSA